VADSQHSIFLSGAKVNVLGWKRRARDADAGCQMPDAAISLRRHWQDISISFRKMICSGLILVPPTKIC